LAFRNRQRHASDGWDRLILLGAQRWRYVLHERANQLRGGEVLSDFWRLLRVTGTTTNCCT